MFEWIIKLPNGPLKGTAAILLMQLVYGWIVFFVSIGTLWSYAHTASILGQNIFNGALKDLIFASTILIFATLAIMNVRKLRDSVPGG